MTPETMRQMLAVLLERLGVHTASREDHRDRWSASDLATDLAPLLVEELLTMKAKAALKEMNECRHQWVELPRVTDRSHKFFCTTCEATHIGTDLPISGKVWSTVLEQKEVEMTEQDFDGVNVSIKSPFAILCGQCAAFVEYNSLDNGLHCVVCDPHGTGKPIVPMQVPWGTDRADADTPTIVTKGGGQ